MERSHFAPKPIRKSGPKVDKGEKIVLHDRSSTICGVQVGVEPLSKVPVDEHNFRSTVPRGCHWLSKDGAARCRHGEAGDTPGSFRGTRCSLF